jgi:hypothetical protein
MWGLNHKDESHCPLWTVKGRPHNSQGNLNPKGLAIL